MGDERPYLTVLISLDAEAVAERGLDGEGVRAGIQAAVGEVNRGLATVRQVKRFAILERPLSIERGELTPTAKVRRKTGGRLSKSILSPDEGHRHAERL